MDGLPVERLRDYLRDLSPGARALLIAELERAVLRGDEIAGGDLVLQEVRRALRESGKSAPRIGSPARMFFRPFEAFLIDDAPTRKHLARIARASLEPIWAWICRDVAPQEAKTFSDEVSAALLADDTASYERLVYSFQDHVADRIRSMFTAVQSDDKARRKMIGQIGTPKALEEVRDLLEILQARDVFAVVESRLPGHIRQLADAQLVAVKALLDSAVSRRGEFLPYALILVMGRLAAPWQLIRLAVKAADSDDAIRIAATPYAAAVTIILADTERLVGELKADLHRGALVAVTSLLKCIHDAVRGVRSELDLPGDSPWGRQLAAIRSEVSAILKAEIESVPGRVRRLLRPRPASEIGPGSSLDPTEVGDTEALIEFVGACRNYAGELAISEMTLRTYTDLQQYLDTGTQTLLDGLRGAADKDRSFRQSQVDAAVRFCAKVFGQDYAALLAKAAGVAALSERKAAAAKA